MEKILVSYREKLPPETIRLADPEQLAVVTIDGPAGAGKSTVSRILAERLRFDYIDTGAMYRVVALRAKDLHIDPHDDGALERLCRELDITFQRDGEEWRIFESGEDLTAAIREPEISMLASRTSARPAVRAAMTELQRRLGQKGRAVFEGRDMGTVVFPRAAAKFFLIADIQSRSERRFLELKDSSDNLTLDRVAADMRQRDHNDQTRPVAPLRPPEDALIVDSTNLTINQVVEKMLDFINKKMN
ncbi:MAG: (d)CMP kinase [Deltaproteobacteria bacterium]|nr:(d)CMP kinase [Deltaproteobacteria bacterium]